ncbi:hypothetical protein KAI54_00435 [Candidatus Gracilibacteria bacterium]|nr:hypothetical protein [Candidatus Gracilibacteria bacterium]
MNKKIILTLAVFTLIFTSGCEKKTTPDPQELLRETFENAFSINSAAFSANGSVKIKDIENSNGEIKFTFEGKGENILKFPPKIDYMIGVEFNFQNPEKGDGDGSVKFSIKMLEDLIFAKFELIELAGNPELEAAKPFIQMLSGKWYKFSLKALAGENPEFEAAFTQQQENQQKFIEFYKKLLSENDLLLAKNLRENGGDFVIEVKPNFDLIFSEKFLDDIRNDFFELVEDIDKNAIDPPEFDDEMLAKLPEIRETVKKVWQAGNFEITMKIGKENRMAHTSTVSGNLDLAEIVKLLPEEMQEEEVSGKIIFDFTSESRDFNQPQNITPPKDFIDFDPAMLLGAMSSSFPAPAEFENADLLQEIPLSKIGEFTPPILEEKDPIMENQPVSRPR